MSKHESLKLTRRETLAALGAFALTARFGAAQAPAPAHNIALQLYTMRDPAKKDLPGTLKRCREMGWEYVQWSGMPDLKAEEIRAALDAAGLKAMSAHIGIEAFETDFAAQVAFWKTVGNKDVAPGGMMGDCRDSLGAWKKGAARLNAVGEKLRAEGMRLSYHNHDQEFQKFEGDDRTKMDILYGETDPKNLCAEIDTAWVQVAGVNPAEYVRKMKGRCPVIHVKDIAEKKRLRGVQFCAVGKGTMKWDEIFAATREAGVEWYVYEQDNTAGDIFEDAAATFAFMKEKLLA